jgi:hypothetical protein
VIAIDEVDEFFEGGTPVGINVQQVLRLKTAAELLVVNGGVTIVVEKVEQARDALFGLVELLGELLELLQHFMLLVSAETGPHGQRVHAHLKRRQGFERGLSVHAVRFAEVNVVANQSYPKVRVGADALRG